MNEEIYINFVCPKCGNSVAYLEQYAGTAQVCPYCSDDIIVPTRNLTERPSPDSQRSLGLDLDTPFTRRLAAIYAWIRRFALYYGDSGIFVRREVYDKIGGVKPMALMEDYEFVRRLERAGRTCRIDDPPLVTSARRFANRPWPAALWGWMKIHLLYWLGVSPGRLARIYARDHERWLQRASMSRQS